MPWFIIGHCKKDTIYSEHGLDQLLVRGSKLGIIKKYQSGGPKAAVSEEAENEIQRLEIEMGLTPHGTPVNSLK